jgi:CBS domain-containing protein
VPAAVSAGGGRGLPDLPREARGFGIESDLGGRAMRRIWSGRRAGSSRGGHRFRAAWHDDVGGSKILALAQMQVHNIPGSTGGARAFLTECRPMRIKDVLTAKGRGVATLWSNRTLRDVVTLFDERNIASVVVTDPQGEPMGLVTDRAVIRALARHGVGALDLPVTRAMAQPFPIVAPDETVSSALKTMTVDRVRHLVVMEEERMIGLVSIGDLVKIRLDDADLERRVLSERALGQMAFE